MTLTQAVTTERAIVGYTQRDKMGTGHLTRDKAERLIRYSIV